MVQEFLEQNCVSYETARALKEIGFDEECIVYYHPSNENYKIDADEHGEYTSSNSDFKSTFTTPFCQQVFDWFDSKGVIGRTEYVEIDSDSFGYCFRITYLHKEYQHEKRKETLRCVCYSYREGFGTYEGAWEKEKDAREKCIERMIEIYKQFVL